MGFYGSNDPNNSVKALKEEHRSVQSGHSSMGGGKQAHHIITSPVCAVS